MSKEDTSASPFAALYNWGNKDTGSGGGGKPKIDLAQSAGEPLRFSNKPRRARYFHEGHYLAGT
ncbi:MAG: hypothetical protein ACRD3W_21120, partial [Terriglobales bacterium]